MSDEKNILVVDCQYDFIDGTLACEFADEAVKNIVALINSNPDAKIYYSLDWHNPEHCSFVNNGGTWPVHCVAKTHGAELHEIFYNEIKNPEQRPNENNMYFKGCNNDVEEYSAFDAKNKSGHALNQDIKSNELTVVGIASEFCVKESILAFMNAGKKIKFVKNCVAYVNSDGHAKNLQELSARGVVIA